MLKLIPVSAALATVSAAVFLMCTPVQKSDDTLNVFPADEVKMEVAVSGLKMPWSMTFLPNGDMLVTERTGQLRLVQNGQLHPDPIKGLPEITYKGQGGLLDVALHPNYAQNDWIYFSYASPAQSGEEGSGFTSAFMRAKLKNHELVEKQVIFRAKPNVNTNHHFAGRIVFDRAGYMYLTVGDRGKKEQAQLLTNHQGKVMRLNDDGSVPKDNPFVGRTDALPEIFSYGHRNPQGLTLNAETGELWEHEHGPQGGDEINIPRAGKNFGWPAITFGIDYDNSIISNDTARVGMEQPITYYKPSIAPCGMTFLKGTKFKAWQGNLLVGSLKFNYLKRCVVKNNKIVSQETIFDKIGRVRDIREAPNGDIYVVVENTGSIMKISPAGM
jgi:aldose sugar dehydrogenase